MQTTPARDPSGLRTVSRVSISTEARAERFAGTAEERLGRLLAAFKRAAPHMAVPAHLRETVDLLWSWTQPQDWRDGARPLVWPSNACLAHELGITERQVRNRLRALESLGIIAAVESPTGKRYGRRDGEGRIVYGYGFDLSPLATRQAEFEAIAEQALAERQKRAEFRRRLTIARKAVAQILEAAGEACLPEGKTWASLEARAEAVAMPDSDAALQLAVQAMEALHVEAREAFEAACQIVERARQADIFPGDITPEGEIRFPHTELQPHPPSRRDTRSLKAHDSQEGSSGSGSGRYPSDAGPEGGSSGAGEQPVTPQLLAFAIPDLAMAISQAGEKPNWPSIVDAAHRLRHTLGISQDAWAQACQVMGREAAAAAVGVIAAKRSDIRSPGGYLRGMTRKAEKGALNLAASVYQARDRRRAAGSTAGGAPAASPGRRPPVPPM